MKSILVITPYLPYQNVGHAGGKAIYDFLVQLKHRGFKVFLVAMAWPEEQRHLQCLRTLCDDSYILVSTPVFTDSFLNSVQARPFLSFPRVLKGCLKHLRLRRLFRSAIRKMIGSHEPDIVQVEYSAMAMYVSRIESKKLRLLHLHDLMAKPYARLLAVEENTVVRIYRYFFFLVLKHIELSFCRRFDKVLVKSEDDRRRLIQTRSYKVQVFPLGVEPRYTIAPFETREPRSVLFLGAMFRGVNEKAAVYFINRVMPVLMREMGSVKFYVVGSSPSKEMRELASDNVVVTGFVDDVGEFYSRCQVFVAPLFVGGGMIFKIVQAMSYGMPVVASTIANEGISAEAGKEILIANEPEEFSTHVTSLMRDPQLWRKVSANGQTFVNTNYAWNRVINEYLTNLEML